MKQLLFILLFFLTLDGCAQRMGLPRSQISTVVFNAKNDINVCYVEAQKQNPDLQGNMVVSWNIQLDGKVTDARIKETTLHNSDLEVCILHVIGRMQFVQPTGSIVEVNYPFIFNSAH